MDINIKLSFGKESIYNMAFIKALFIKKRIEALNISYKGKEIIKKQILDEMEKAVDIKQKLNSYKEEMMNEKED